MRRYPFFILFLILSFQLSAQVAIIQDKDGYTNVRTQPNAKSAIIYVLHDNEMFEYNTEDDTSKWVKVFIRKNKFDIHPWAEDNSLIGYIHRSRILDIGNLTMDEVLCSFKPIVKPFVAAEHIIDYDGNNAVKIDGRYPFGIDGLVPTKETVDIEVYVDGVLMPIPKVLFENLYQSNRNPRIVNYYQTYFITEHNSDGAGGYTVYWAVDHSGLQQRIMLLR